MVKFDTSKSANSDGIYVSGEDHEAKLVEDNTQLVISKVIIDEYCQNGRQDGVDKIDLVEKYILKEKNLFFITEEFSKQSAH